jgi:DNA-binding Lrp family transcriptional regulator
MDRIDRKILAIYQSDTRRTAAWIGEEVGLSAAAVQRRLKSLRALGTIRAEVAVLDSRVVGVPITCIVLLTMVSRPGPALHLDQRQEQTRGIAGNRTFPISAVVEGGKGNHNRSAEVTGRSAKPGSIRRLREFNLRRPVRP